MEEFTKEFNRLQATEGSRFEHASSELARIERRLRNIIEAIGKACRPGPSSKSYWNWKRDRTSYGGAGEAGARAPTHPSQFGRGIQAESGGAARGIIISGRVYPSGGNGTDPLACRRHHSGPREWRSPSGGPRRACGDLALAAQGKKSGRTDRALAEQIKMVAGLAATFTEHELNGDRRFKRTLQRPTR